MFRFTLDEVLTELEENQFDENLSDTSENEIDVAVLPPIENGVTDEDSDNSDDEVVGSFLHLPRRIMNSEAETHTLTKSSSSSDETQVPGKKKKVERKWNKKIPESSLPSEPRQMYGLNIDEFLNSSISTPLDAFFTLFSHDLVGEIVRQTILYAQQRGNLNFSITKEKLICFLGILLISGYHPAPYRRLYWSNEPDMHNDLITALMRRNKFDEILQ